MWNRSLGGCPPAPFYLVSGKIGFIADLACKFGETFLVSCKLFPLSCRHLRTNNLLTMPTPFNSFLVNVIHEFWVGQAPREYPVVSTRTESIRKEQRVFCRS